MGQVSCRGNHGLLRRLPDREKIEVFISEHNRERSIKVEPYDATSDAADARKRKEADGAGGHAGQAGAPSDRRYNLTGKDPDGDGMDYVDCLLVIRNRTGNDIYIGDEEFEIGYDSIELKIRFRNGETFDLKKRSGVWHRNLPDLSIIPHGGALSIPITLDPEIWENIPLWTSEQRQKTMDDPFLKSPCWDNVSLLIPGREVCIKATIRWVGYSGDSNGKKGGRAYQWADFETEWVSLLFRVKRTIPTDKSGLFHQPVAR
jgi:hypothetical protein